jgi:hypothetical protein
MNADFGKRIEGPTVLALRPRRSPPSSGSESAGTDSVTFIREDVGEMNRCQGGKETWIEGGSRSFEIRLLGRCREYQPDVGSMLRVVSKKFLIT